YRFPLAQQNALVPIDSERAEFVRLFISAYHGLTLDRFSYRSPAARDHHVALLHRTSHFRHAMAVRTDNPTA
ncbi:MAG TPA: hypothetical protein VKJ45_22815, partial [Blastocatellia bacterium]|nr:hypothetical protein [Blastocatellia bacterium]